MGKYEPKHLKSRAPARGRPEAASKNETKKVTADTGRAPGNSAGGSAAAPVGVLGISLRVLSFVFATVFIILAGALGVVYMMSRGPSPSATTLFVRSVRETSAAGFLAEIFLSEEEILEIESSGKTEVSADSVDSSLITIAHRDTDEGGEPVDEGSGIELRDVYGASFYGKMMIISDPERVSVGVTDHLGVAGQTLADMIESNGAIGGVNGGGFYDPGGSGNGGIPDGVVIRSGELLYGAGVRADTAVIDYDGILHVGTMTGEQALELGAEWAISFGPVLVVNGEKCDGLDSGLNPRTAIGQRADGAILLLVINGRMLDSLGATYEDVADVMLDFGAVNALNLDGGSSTMMIYEGEFMNTSASLVGQRGLPTCILVK